MRRSLIQWVLIGAVIPCLGLLLTADRAAASCGDYVHVDGVSRPKVDHPTPPPAPVKPCNGPMCRRLPPVEPMAPTVPPSPGVDKEVVVDSLRSCHDRPCDCFDLHFPNSIPETLGSSIFHPPR